MRFACIVSAAGRGERFGGDVPKAFQPLGGRPMLDHSLTAVGNHPAVELLVVAAPGDRLREAEAIASAAGLPIPVIVVAGGATRGASVRAALAAVPAGIEGVLVHDAARPFVPSAVVDAVVSAVAAGAAGVVPGVPVIDTIKQVDDHDVVITTPPRDQLRAIQTPQGFQVAVLHEALARSDDGATDDAGMVERSGWPVSVVPGHPDAFKITTPDDRMRAEELLHRRAGHVQ